MEFTAHDMQTFDLRT